MPETEFRPIDSPSESESSQASQGTEFRSIGNINLPMQSQADKNMAGAGELATPKSLSRKYIAPYLQPTLTGIGGGIGGAVAAPLGPVGMLGGGFSGGMIGNLTSQYLQNQAPEYFGESGSDPNSTVDQLEHAMGESANQESGGMAVGAGIGLAKNLPTMIRAGKPLLNRAYETAKVATGINPGQSEEQLAVQAGKSARDNFTKVSDAYDVSAGKLNSKANSTATPYYREIKPEPDETTQEGEEGLEPKEPTYEAIKAPIPISGSQAVAKKTYNQLSKSLSNAPLPDKDVKNVMRNLKTLVEEEPATDKIGQSQGIPVTEFYKVDRLKNSITNYLTKHPSGTTVAPDPTVDSLTDLNLALTEDIDKGLQSWGNDAYKNYAERQNLWINKANIANSPMSQRLLTQGVDPQTAFETIGKDALKDVSSARQFVTTTNDRPTLMKMAQRQMLEKASDPTTGVLNPLKALQDLNSDPVYNIAIPSQTLSNTKELLKAVSSNQSNRFANTVRGLTIGHGGFQLGVASPFVAHQIGIPYKLSYGIIGGAKLTGFAIDKLMANPTTARALIQAARTPFDSPLMNTLTKVIITGLKNESNLQLQDENGNSYDARVNNDNKIAIQ